MMEPSNTHTQTQTGQPCGGGTTPRRRCRKHPFTIIENSVSMLVLSMVLGGSYNITGQSGRILQASVDHYLAASTAVARLERMHSSPIADLPLFAEDRVRLNDSGTLDPDGSFRRSVVVDNSSGPDLAMVTVTVEVIDRRTGRFTGTSESVSLIMTEFH